MIEIHARRWFQRTYGNTYHSVRVYVNGKLIGHNPFTYGYGEQYLATALSLLQEAGIRTKTGKSLPSGANLDYCEFQNDMREHPDNYRVFVTDVQRKKDL